MSNKSIRIFIDDSTISEVANGSNDALMYYIIPEAIKVYLQWVLKHLRRNKDMRLNAFLMYRMISNCFNDNIKVLEWEVDHMDTHNYNPQVDLSYKQYIGIKNDQITISNFIVNMVDFIEYSLHGIITNQISSEETEELSRRIIVFRRYDGIEYRIY